MTSPPFEPPALCGPLRRPRQMPTEPTEIEQRIAKLRPPGPLVILNHAVMKASYAAYDREAAELGTGR